MTSHLKVPTNNAVSWEGTRFGLFPKLSRAAEQMLEEGEEIRSALLDAIVDPDRFVTAHVLLTRRTGVQHETFPSWNGLMVDLKADGTVHVDPEQRHKIAQTWQLYFEAKERPDKLPGAK